MLIVICIRDRGSPSHDATTEIKLLVLASIALESEKGLFPGLLSAFLLSYNSERDKKLD